MTDYVICFYSLTEEILSILIGQCLQELKKKSACEIL